MHLQTGVVVTVLALAAGTAVGRATAPHGESPPVVAGAGSHGVSSGWSDLGNSRRSVPAGSPPVAKGREVPGFDHSSRPGEDARPQAAVVYVAGAVAKPGVYRLRATARADEAVRAAGGATAQADLVAINLAARVEDGEEIAVPVRGAEADVLSRAERPAAKQSRRHSTKRGHRKRHKRSDDATDEASSPTEVVDVNDADEATLETLPGVGPSLAERIVAFRDLNGPFASTDELLDVGGMTAGKVDALAPYVSFH